MAVVAVHDFDVDADVSHAAREETKLTRHILLQSLHEDVALLQHPNTSCFQRRAGHRPVLDEEMRDTDAANDPGPSTFDAHASVTQRLAHLRERSGPVVQNNR